MDEIFRNKGDVVLIYYQDAPTIFARVESIDPDIKKGWYHATLLLLTIPTQVVSWILRAAYINGEPFTMGGISMRLEEVKASDVAPAAEESTANQTEESPSSSATIIPFKKPATDKEDII